MAAHIGLHALDLAMIPPGELRAAAGILPQRRRLPRGVEAQIAGEPR